MTRFLFDPRLRRFPPGLCVLVLVASGGLLTPSGVAGQLGGSVLRPALELPQSCDVDNTVQRSQNCFALAIGVLGGRSRAGGERRRPELVGGWLGLRVLRLGIGITTGATGLAVDAANEGFAALTLTHDIVANNQNASFPVAVLVGMRRTWSSDETDRAVGSLGLVTMMRPPIPWVPLRIWVLPRVDLVMRENEPGAWDKRSMLGFGVGARLQGLQWGVEIVRDWMASEDQLTRESSWLLVVTHRFF